jgi:maltooligosyltrehalose trehalohydrolase
MLRVSARAHCALNARCGPRTSPKRVSPRQLPGRERGEGLAPEGWVPSAGMWSEALQRPFGAVPLAEGGVEFRVWAPAASTVAVRAAGSDHELAPAEGGVFAAEVPAQPGDDYLYVLDGGDALPDPSSRWQPGGIKGPSRIVDTSRFDIADGPNLPLEELVLYELHVGTFTPEGTFDAVIPHLAELHDLGVTAIELMPVATFAGDRGWGYDGVYIGAPHPAYGGPAGLARLVDAAHRAGLGVILDVVYNHIGPGSEAVGRFGPYFTDAHHTFWGDAIDYSQRGVREWAIGNALLWTRDYRIDGLRLDAVHAVYDDSPVHVLRELRERVDGLVISEMGPEDFRPLTEWGHDAMWLDSLHHELHVLLTGEREGYYANFGSMEGLVRELTRGQPERLVVCAQNHDQVGNRALGDRLPPKAHRVALAIVLFSLNTPLLFMGEEHDEPTPFRFFTDHIDPFIADATREGRKREFAAFTSFSGAEVPDPQALETFESSKLTRGGADPLYGELLRLRRELPRELLVDADGTRLTMRRGKVELIADFAAQTVELLR